MEKKRLVIDLEEVTHTMLMQQAQRQNMTLANYVRQALQLPMERKGARPDPMQVVRTTIEDVSEFYISEGRASFQVWIPGPGGNPFPVSPQPRLQKAEYVSPDDVRAGNFQYAQTVLSGPYPLLLLDVAHSFTPPLRAVRLFARDDRRPDPITYLATTSKASWTWMSDLDHNKRGFFLTGLPRASDLWQILYIDVDPADRCVFVISPVRLPHGLPTPDFSKIADPAVRSEAEHHWKNLEQAVISHSAYALVNSAASLSEALLRAFLKAPGAHRENLGEMLRRLHEEIQNKKSAFSSISYPIMESVRIMHQSTQHPGRVVIQGRPIRPQFALTIAEGMVEILTCLGIVQ